MRIPFLIQSFLWPKPLRVGSKAPKLSLTSQDGTWVKCDDYRDRWNLLLLFARNIEEEKARRGFASDSKTLKSWAHCSFCMGSPGSRARTGARQLC